MNREEATAALDALLNDIGRCAGGAAAEPPRTDREHGAAAFGLSDRGGLTCACPCGRRAKKRERDTMPESGDRVPFCLLRTIRICVDIPHRNPAQRRNSRRRRYKVCGGVVGMSCKSLINASKINGLQAAGRVLYLKHSGAERSGVICCLFAAAEDPRRDAPFRIFKKGDNVILYFPAEGRIPDRAANLRRFV